LRRISSNNSLIQKIDSAFSDTVYPGNENLFEDSYGNESAILRNHFLGFEDWRLLTNKHLNMDGALSFLSEKAFRFYIPAFMIADINEKLKYNDPIVRLCWSISPQSESKKIAKVWGGTTEEVRAKKCFDKFSKEQTSSIVSYLYWRLSLDEYDFTVKYALDNYWLNREESFL